MWGFNDLIKDKNQFLDQVKKGTIEIDTMPNNGPEFNEEYVNKLIENAEKGFDMHRKLFGVMK